MWSFINMQNKFLFELKRRSNVKLKYARLILSFVIKTIFCNFHFRNCTYIQVLWPKSECMTLVNLKVTHGNNI